MKLTRLTSGLVAASAALALAACGVSSADTASTAGTTGTTTSQTSTSSTGSTVAADFFKDNLAAHSEADDADYTASEASTVTLKDGASTVTGSGVSVDGDTVTITAPGTYVVSGTLRNGSLVVASEAEGKVRIVLSNASITNAGGAAIAVTAADEVVLVLADGTTNALADGTGYDTSAQDAPNAALFSMADLTIAGTGSLNVTGNTNDGISSKDGLVILSGSVTVTAVDDALRGKDYVIVEGGTLKLTAEQDGIKSDNETDDTVGYVQVSGGTVSITAGDDGIHAEGDLAITGGTIEISRSSEGIEGANIAVTGGATTITATDDGVNVSSGVAGANQGPGGGQMADDGSLLLITGGTLVVNSDGDGLDSNGSTTISGGTTVVNGPTMNGNGALDSNGGIDVTGGTVVAAGSSGMAEAPESASAQGWISISFSPAIEAGQTVQVVSGDTVIASYTTTKSVASLVIAADGIESGTAYDIYVGGQLAKDAVGTYSASGSTTGATSIGSVTAGQHTSGGRP